MKPPYTITPAILNLIEEVSVLIGEVNSVWLNKSTPQLRKKNRIKTICGTLQIEGNTLGEEQITAILENKKVIGSAQKIAEVQNALKAYENLPNCDSKNEAHFLKTHKLLMAGLTADAGSYRKISVGIAKGKKIEHVAPPPAIVRGLIKNLFYYLKKSHDSALIKSCVFHYELEFIHPFSDGNGRMGRYWQTLILKEKFPLFEFLPIENMIKKNQKLYYKTLAICDKKGDSALFIELMLDLIKKTLKELLGEQNKRVSDTERLNHFLTQHKGVFSRKDYLLFFKNISTSTASRDLKTGVELKWLSCKGEKNKAIYRNLKK